MWVDRMARVGDRMAEREGGSPVIERFVLPTAPCSTRTTQTPLCRHAALARHLPKVLLYPPLALFMGRTNLLRSC